MTTEDKNRLVAGLREGMKGYTEYGDDFTGDQADGVAAPPLVSERDYLRTIPLAREFDDVIKVNDFKKLLFERQSVRRYQSKALTLDELAFLLYASDGVKKVDKRGVYTLRTAPSAGARHPIETYVFVNNVEGLEEGLYHYIATEHKLGFLGDTEGRKDFLSAAFCGQAFFAFAPVAFVWSAVPYRSEWRYASKASKYALLDAGHICQNLYLAAGAIECGACAIGAYMQEQADAMLQLESGESAENDNEFAIYAASVGKL